MITGTELENNINTKDWQIPCHEVKELNEKSHKYCLIIPIINELEKISKQFKNMEEREIFQNIDVIIADGGSTDGSTDIDFLKSFGIKTLLVKQDAGKLSAQLRMAYSYALKQGYEGIITVDGNNKDSVESVYDFIRALDDGYDMVQGSRFVKGGKAINTPLSRLVAIKCIHAPIISIIARKIYTDTTNGYRSYSRNYLLHPKVQPFRNIFNTYELLAYLSVRANQLKLKTKEIPVERRYPLNEPVPTKIKGLKGNWELIKILWNLFSGKFNP